MAAVLERALGPAPEVPEEAEPVPVLVVGPAGSGRTSLLLRAALAGGGDGPRALFMAPCALPRLPGGAGGGGDDPRALQRLELRYPPSAGALGRELAEAAARPRRPGLLLLDGFERYLSGGFRGSGEGGVQGVAARLAALLLEAARGPGPPRPPAQVVASLLFPPSPGPRVLPVLRRFFPAQLRLRPPDGTTAPSERPLRGFRARLTRPGAPPRRWRLRFDPRGRLHVGPDDSDGNGDSEDDDEDAAGE